MNIVISKKLESDIMNFVKLNEIDDLNNFLEVCLYNGFNLAKYGVSPQDNYQNENKPLKIEKYDLFVLLGSIINFILIFF